MSTPILHLNIFTFACICQIRKNLLQFAKEQRNIFMSFGLLQGTERYVCLALYSHSKESNRVVVRIG